MVGRIPIVFLAASRRSSPPACCRSCPATSRLSRRWRRDSSDVRARRVACSWEAFRSCIGFTLVFVALGALAGALGSVVDRRVFQEIAGLVLVVIGLAFAHLLPMPQRLVAPSLLVGARDSGSNVLLGGAFAVCAAPCVSPILVLGARPRGQLEHGDAGSGAPVRVLAGSRDSVRPCRARVRAGNGVVSLAARSLPLLRARRRAHARRARPAVLLRPDVVAAVDLSPLRLEVGRRELERPGGDRFACAFDLREHAPRRRCLDAPVRKPRAVARPSRAAARILGGCHGPPGTTRRSRARAPGRSRALRAPPRATPARAPRARRRSRPNG